jgi:hypothetical protein
MFSAETYSRNTNIFQSSLFEYMYALDLNNFVMWLAIAERDHTCHEWERKKGRKEESEGKYERKINKIGRKRLGRKRKNRNRKKEERKWVRKKKRMKRESKLKTCTAIGCARLNYYINVITCVQRKHIWNSWFLSSLEFRYNRVLLY